METLYDFFAKPTDPRRHFGIRIALASPEQIRKFCILNAKCVHHRYLRNQLLIGINLADLGVLPNLHPDEDQRQNDRNAADYFGDQSVLLEFFPQLAMLVRQIPVPRTA